MKSRVALLLLLILGLFVIVWKVRLPHSLDGEAAAGDKQPEPVAGHQGVADDSRIPAAHDSVRRSGRERSDVARLQSLADLKREFDEILPAQYPEQYSSLCDATLKLGETLVLGGFKTADGKYEFTTLRVDPNGDENIPAKYRIAPKTMVLSHEQCEELGLTDLLSPATMRIQKSIVRSTDALSQMNSDSMIMSMPSVSVQPHEAAKVSVGTEQQARVISFIAEPASGGGTIRLRTRIESPTGTGNP